MTLPQFSVERRVAITMLILIIVVLAFISFSRIGLGLFPDIEFPIVSVIITYPGASPEEIENSVTKFLEDGVSTVSGVKSIESITQEGLSAVMVEFEWGTNLDFAAQDIRDRLAMYEGYFPQDAGKPVVLKFDISMMPIVAYGVVGGDTKELRKTLEDVVKERLERTDGVASCMIFGGKIREILVSVDKKKLESYNISLSQVSAFLRVEDVNISGGWLKKGYREYLVRTVSEYRELDDIRNSVVGYTKVGTPVYLRDVAEVTDTHREIRDVQRIDLKEGVMMMVSKSSGANPLTVSKRIEKELGKLEKFLPGGIKFYTLFSQGEIIEKIVKRTSSNIIWGGLLAILAIFFFLRNWRPTLIIGIAIPFSIITAFIAIHFAGYTLNLMTLGGLALGVGMLVDNAIVVIENIFRHIEEGKTRKIASRIGAEEVTRAITASTITTVVVFLPLFYAGGIAGKISRGLALTVAFALCASLLVALTIIPMIASMLFKKERFRPTRFERIRNWYKSVLGFSLGHRKRVLITTGGIFVFTIFLVLIIGGEFMPKMDQHFLMMMVRMPPGTNLEETDRVVKQIEEFAIKLDDVEDIGAIIGMGEMGEFDAAYGTGPSDVNEAQVMLGLVERSKRKKSSEEIVNELRSNIPKLHGVKVEFIDPGEMMMGGGMVKPVDIKIFGLDLDSLKSISERVVSRIEDVEGIEDVENSMKAGKSEWKVNIDKELLSNFGLTSFEVANAIKGAMRGVVATKLRKGGEETDVRVKFKSDDIAKFEDIRNLSIITPTGTKILLKQVAEVGHAIGPVKIEREGNFRKASVTANVRGRDLKSAMGDVRKALDDMSLPQGYFIEFGGEYKEMVSAFKTLGYAFALAIVLVYMVMAVAFESLVHPLVIMFTVPLSWIGAILLLLLSGKTISLVSGIGILILAGIAVNNGIVMVDFINRLRKKGMDRKSAIINGASIRLRPILITAITTILGMLPMVLSKTEGSEMRAPIAITVIGGLLASTLLTLVVIPVVYTIFDDLAHRTKKIAKKKIHGEE